VSENIYGDTRLAILTLTRVGNHARKK